MPDKIYTAAELEAMSPAERKALFDESVVWDLKDAPAGLVDRLRRSVEEREASRS